MMMMLDNASSVEEEPIDIRVGHKPTNYVGSSDEFDKFIYCTNKLQQDS